MTVAPRFTEIKPNRTKSAQVKQMPEQLTHVPLWLRLLMLLQHSSSVFAFSITAAALGIYGWTFYTPELWNQEYQKLETLRRHERNLMTANETLKNELAKQAQQPGTGLVSPEPSQVIFLPPIDVEDESKTIPAEGVSPSMAPTAPLGY